MDADLSSLAHDRVADAIPLTGVSLAATGGEYRERPMPVGGAILWTPVGLARVNPAYPIFITRQALDAVHAQRAGLPGGGGGGASSLGFLAGGMYQTPDTRIPYIVVESAIHLPWSIGGDHLEPALRQGRVIAQEEARRRGEQLLGWYHSHSAAHARLSVSDVEAHVACFDQPWHFALVVARGAELTGGVFRIASRAVATNEYLPFYELPETGARSATHVSWANYHTQQIAPSAGAGLFSQTKDAGPPLLLFPSDDDDPDPDVRAPARPARRFFATPLARVARLGAVGLVAGGVLFGAYKLFASAPGGGEGADASPAGAAVTLESIDRSADTVALVITAFQLRLRLFDDRKMVCVDLARGLMELEARWIAHNTARRSNTGQLDSVRTARDRRLNADVSAVERGFARTGCPRP